MSKAAGWQRELIDMLRLGLPLAFTQLAQILINTTDVILMGWLHTDALAAGGLALGVLVPMLYFGIGMMIAIAPVIAQAVGRDDPDEVQRTMHHGLWLATLVSLPAMALLTFAGPILTLLGQDAKIAYLAHDYLQPLLWGMPAALALTVLRCFAATFNRTGAIMLVGCFGVVINGILCWALMFGKLGLPRLEIVGAGIATSLVNWIMLLLLAAYILRDRHFKRYRLLQRWWRVEWRSFKQLVRLGAPIGLTLVMETGIFSTAALIMGALGTAELAAHQIALQLASIAFMTSVGISQAASIRVGLAVGRGDLTGLRRAGWSALLIGCAFMTTSALLFWLLPERLTGFFLRADDLTAPQTAELAVTYLSIAGLFQLVDGAQVIGQGALRGMRDTTAPMLIAGAGYWLIAFPICLSLGFFTPLGGAGVWIGLAIGLAIVALAIVWRFHRQSRRLPLLV